MDSEGSLEDDYGEEGEAELDEEEIQKLRALGYALPDEDGDDDEEGEYDQFDDDEDNEDEFDDDEYGDEDEEDEQPPANKRQKK